MSGSLANIYNNVNYALHLHSAAMTRLQEQASTGSRINRVSDDPSTAYRVMGLNTQQRSLDNYADNLSEVVSLLDLSSTVVEEIASVLTETRVRLTQIAGGIYGDDARQRAAEGINDILEQAVSLANTKHMGQYLFGGGDISSAPYLVERTGGEITRVTYQGSYENRNVEVAPGVNSSGFYVGDEMFRSDDRGQLVFLGETGAKTGTGTSTIRGDVWLTVTGSAGNYTLSIDDGLTTFNTDGTHTNLAVTNSTTGEILYVDTTGITATGVDMVRAPGTHDIFNTLISIRDVLQNEKGLSGSQLRQLQDNALISLEEVNGLIVEAEVAVGSRVGFLSNLKDSLKNLKYDAEDETTRLQEADIAQIAIDISRREILYQMSLSVAGKLMSISLLDFLR
ncbi:MAG: flagellar hook-associated protein FlgL [Planctomycetota bacterium]|jgi:flagellar hook-associated protein 3 FlgL